MHRGADGRLGVRLRVLDERQLEDIHLASLEIPSRTGIVMEHEGVLDFSPAPARWFPATGGCVFRRGW